MQQRNIRVSEPRGADRFSAQSRGDIALIDNLRRKDLKRNSSLKRGLIGVVHDAHAATPKLGTDLIAINPWHEQPKMLAVHVAGLPLLLPATSIIIRVARASLTPELLSLWRGDASPNP